MAEGRVALDDDVLDGTARELKAIGAELDGIEKRLVTDLAAGVPARMKADVVGTLVEVRKSVERKAESSRSQAGELKIRAVLTRLAAGEGSERDVAILLSLCAGPGAIDPKKRPKLYGAIIALQNAAFGGPILGPGAESRKPNAVDKAMTRWAKWMGRGALDRRPFGSGSLTKLRGQVLGQQMAEASDKTVSHPGSNWPNGPAESRPDPVVEQPGSDAPSGGVSIDAPVTVPRRGAPDKTPGSRPATSRGPRSRQPDTAAAH